MKTAPVTIRFASTIYTLKSQTILSVPKDESVKLPSRGQISVTGMINGHEFKTVLEPDGNWSHWMRVDKRLQASASVRSGEVVDVQLTTNTEWPEPTVPQDFKNALAAAPEKVKHKWQDITPMARWEWIRWVNATSNMDTRDIRIEKTISKLNGKHRRPCCFNLAACTDPELSKNGRLIEPVAVHS